LSEIHTSEIKTIRKKPILKDWRFWVGCAILLVFIASRFDSHVPDGIEKDFYRNALVAFHKLNVAYEEQEVPDNDVIKWIADHTRSMESYPEDYTDREKYILNSLRSMVVDVGMLKSFGKGNEIEQKIIDARSNLAKALEVDENY
jgi:hypothetical protein